MEITVGLGTIFSCLFYGCRYNVPVRPSSRTVITGHIMIRI